jgi:hypothetical protein
VDASCDHLVMHNAGPIPNRFLTSFAGELAEAARTLGT